MYVSKSGNWTWVGMFDIDEGIVSDVGVIRSSSCSSASLVLITFRDESRILFKHTAQHKLTKVVDFPCITRGGRPLLKNGKFN